MMPAASQRVHHPSGQNPAKTSPPLACPCHPKRPNGITRTRLRGNSRPHSASQAAIMDRYETEEEATPPTRRGGLSHGKATGDPRGGIRALLAHRHPELPCHHGVRRPRRHERRVGERLFRHARRLAHRRIRRRAACAQALARRRAAARPRRRSGHRNGVAGHRARGRSGPASQRGAGRRRGRKRLGRRKRGAVGGVHAGSGVVRSGAGHHGPRMGLEAPPVLVSRQLSLPDSHPCRRHRPRGRHALAAHIVAAAPHRGVARNGQRVLREAAARRAA